MVRQDTIGPCTLDARTGRPKAAKDFPSGSTIRDSDDGSVYRQIGTFAALVLKRNRALKRNRVPEQDRLVTLDQPVVRVATVGRPLPVTRYFARTLSAVRRFLARPSGVALSPIGNCSP